MLTAHSTRRFCCQHGGGGSSLRVTFLSFFFSLGGRGGLVGRVGPLEEGGDLLEALGPRGRQRVAVRVPQQLRERVEAARDLLAQLMRFEPDARVGARDALGHPYCADFHRPDAYPVPHRLGRPVGAPLDDNKKRGTRVYRDALYATIEEEERRGGRNTKV